MGDKTSLVAGYQPGSTIVQSESTVNVNNQNNIVSGSEVRAGTYVGIFVRSPFNDLSKVESISITSGGNEVSYYLVKENASSTWGQPMFLMPEGDVTVTVVFNAHSVTSVGENGSVLISRGDTSESYFFEGETVTIRPIPSTGYEFVSFTCNPTSIIPEKEYKQWAGTTGGPTFTGNYTFTMGSENVTINAEFRDVNQEYNITLQQANGGTIAASKTKAVAGETVTITATPSKGYTLKSLSSEQITGLSASSSSFEMPACDVTISVEFEQMSQLTCAKVDVPGPTTLDISVAADIGVGMTNPMFLIAGTYEGDIVINAYSRISVGTDHTERIALSTQGLQEIFIQLVDGISSNPTGYYCIYHPSEA
jgi:hypothetical protein